MADMIESVVDYPEISFIEDYTISQLENDMYKWYQEKTKELTGEDIVLTLADERRLILSTCAYYLYLGYKYVDSAAKMGMLKYSAGDYLENLGALKGISRRGATGSITTMRFSMVSARASATGVPKGTRVTSGDGVFFATDYYAEIPAGGTYIDVQATCLTTGKDTNMYSIGEINTMVDIVPYIDSAENLTMPASGMDIETDADLRERIFKASNSYAAGGTKAAYEYMVREFDPTIEDVLVVSPAARYVTIYVLLYGGALPGQEYIDDLTEYISQDDKKMLTDQIEVSAPTVISYDIDITYYINESQRSAADAIQEKVRAAVENYKTWQSMKIGRDLNPDELRRLVLNAGAKRLTVTSPSFSVMADTAVSVAGNVNIVYGGIEDD